MQNSLKKVIYWLLLSLLGLVWLGLAGCGGSPPTLAQADQPTFVFIYADG